MAAVVALPAAAHVWRLVELARLPDVGEPFDVAAFAASVPDDLPADRNAFTFYQSALNALPGRRSHAYLPGRRLIAQRRIIEVNGEAASVFGLQQADGRHGIVLDPGERFQVALENRSGVATLIHWHGQAPPIEQDGVPGLSQPALAPNASYAYDFAARPGTHWMHSHEGLQEQLLMSAPLIIHDRRDKPSQQEIVLMLHDFGRPDQQHLISDMLDKGAFRPTFGLTEPEHGSDATFMETRAVRAEHHGEAGWRINGQQMWTTGMHAATHCCLFARTSGEDGDARGITCFLVPAHAPGVKIEEYLWTFNMPTDHPRVSFNNVYVPAGEILGDPENGLAVAQHFVRHGDVLQHPARALGVGAHALYTQRCEAGALALAGGADAPAHLSAALARRWQHQIGGRHRRHLDLQIDAVEQGTGDARLVVGSATRAAPAALSGGGAAAAAGVHGGDQLDAP